MIFSTGSIEFRIVFHMVFHMCFSRSFTHRIGFSHGISLGNNFHIHFHRCINLPFLKIISHFYIFFHVVFHERYCEIPSENAEPISQGFHMIIFTWYFTFL